MPHYLLQVSYTSEGWDALLQNPQNRAEHVGKVLKNLGGKLHEAYFAFGEHDVIVTAELPSSVDAAAIAIAVAAGGACKSVKTTPLLTIEEGLEAIKKAKTSGYRPASKTSSAKP